MAKRKRLTPANPAFLGTQPEAPTLRAAPIADVAREAATTAAAEELAQTLTAARQEGRMVIAIPLDQIVLDHLVRDRIAVDADEMEALKASIRARGQQTPVELVELETGSFGLISGWRRIKALTELYEDTGEERFSTVQALLRQPEDVAEAYQAMVEENEIRAGLSHFERARIVAKAVEQGVFDSERTALQTLFESASRARRSKIGSFLPVVAELDGCLRFPQALTERLGLALAKGMESDDSLAPRLRGKLRGAGSDSPEAEQALLEQVLGSAPIQTRPGPEPEPEPEPETETAQPPAPSHADQTPPAQATPAQTTPAPRRMQVVTGIALTEEDGRLVLEGNRVDDALRQKLVAWLRAQA